MHDTKIPPLPPPSLPFPSTPISSPLLSAVEIFAKDLELVQLHEIEEVEGAKDKLTDGKVKVDYATGKVGTKGKRNGAKRLGIRRSDTIRN